MYKIKTILSISYSFNFFKLLIIYLYGPVIRFKIKLLSIKKKKKFHYICVKNK